MAITSWSAPQKDSPAAHRDLPDVDAGTSAPVPAPAAPVDAGAVITAAPQPVPPPPGRAAAPARRGPRQALPRVVVHTGSDSTSAAVRAFFERRLTRAQVVRDASDGFALGLLVTSGGGAAAVHVACKVTIATLPRNKLLGALSSSADASGDGFSRAELLGDASRDCARALAEETDAWLRAHGDAR